MIVHKTRIIFQGKEKPMSKLTCYSHYELRYVTAYNYRAQGRFVHRADRRAREAMVYVEKDVPASRGKAARWR